MPKLSAGRVQSVATRLVVERERERIAFVAAEYWDILGTFAAASEFTARLASAGGRRGAPRALRRWTAGASRPAATSRATARSPTRRRCNSTSRRLADWQTPSL